MCVCVCVCVCVCLCVLAMLAINGRLDISGLPRFAGIGHPNKIKNLLKEPPAKLLKTYLKDNSNIRFVVI